MVRFKIYDKNQKKFVGQDASARVWDVRYKLDIWNNTVRDDKLDEMYKIMNRNDPHLELYVKHKGRFTPYSRNISKEISENYKQSQKSRPKITLKERREMFKKLIQEARSKRKTQKRKWIPKRK